VLQVLLLSARDALLSRLVLARRCDAANAQRFCRVAFGAFAGGGRGRGSSSSTQAAAHASGVPGAGGRTAAELAAAAEGLLAASGVPELEERVLGYLCEAAAGLKLLATLDDTGRLLAEVGGVGWGGAGRLWRARTHACARACVRSRVCVSVSVRVCRAVCGAVPAHKEQPMHLHTQPQPATP
jgi:hypothetical protein